MKRRLTVSILVAVAVALLIVGVGTVVLARSGAARAAEEDVRSQAESTADLIAFAQLRSGALSRAQLDTLRAMLCPNDPTSRSSATGGSGTGGSGTGGSGTAPTTVAGERLRAAICAASPSALVNQAEGQMCGPSPRIDTVLSPEMRSTREAFCQDPTPETLGAVRTAYCSARPPDTGGRGALARRAEQLRVNLCRLITSPDERAEALRNTLNKDQSIELLTLDAQNTIVTGTLPPELTPDDLQPDRLRAGETVSARMGGGAYAASAVDPTASDLSVILIARPTNPIQGAVPWLVLASAVTLLIALVLARSLSRRLIQPLREASAATTRIAEGDLAVRLPEHQDRPGPPRDELDGLAHSINTMAEALERSRGLERQFLLSVSHDLRTPLTSIRGYAEAITDGATDPARAASIIMTESGRLERLVQDLLDLANLDARRFSFHVMPVDLNEIAQDSVDGFRRDVEAAGRQILTLVAPDPVVVAADPDRLQQVMANLIENALRHATSTITVRVVDGTSADGGGQPGTSRIEVSDDGPGIADADLPHVFERLYVAAASPRRTETGSGLGLAIVRELVEAMGGRVEAASAPEGARLIVHLPTSLPPSPTVPGTVTA